MKINKQFSIKKIPHNFVVVKKTKNKGTVKKGKKVKPNNKYRETKKYFPTLLLACSYIQRESIDISDVKSIKNSLAKATKELVKAIKKFKQATNEP